ncbi:MAG: hypothetical protein JWM74_4275, partial [Myxococcaceae bacterium]|nr:hypothetical protein [Myxococcaceae bacterium]
MRFPVSFAVLVAAVACATGSVACGGGSVPDPKDAADAYAAAAAQGDSDAIYEMMTVAGKK